MLEKRLKKGIEYFRGIKPSEFNIAHFTHFKFFLGLVEKYMKGKEKKTIVEEAKEIFEINNGGV